MSSARSAFGALFLLWLAGNGLRLTILAVPPVLALIIVDLRLSGTEVGLLNAIPVFLFALVAIPGSLLIARVGAVPALNVGQLPASLILLVMSSRWERKRWPLLVAAIIGLIGIASVLLGTNLWTVITAAALIGFSCATMLTLVLTLPALLVARDDVPRMSAGIFTIAYGVAMLVSILGGIAWDISGKPAFAFAPIVIALLPAILFALVTDFSTRRS